MGNFTVINFVISTPSVVISESAFVTSKGGGSCLTFWVCSNWSPCLNGVRSRTCQKDKQFCYVSLNEKPNESQSCSETNSEINSQQLIANTASLNAESFLTGRAINLAFEKGEVTKKGLFGSMTLSILLIPEYFLFKIGRKKKKIEIPSSLARFELFFLILIGAILIGVSNFVIFSNVF